MSKPKAPSPQQRADYFARVLALLALLIALFGAWLNYESSLAELSAKVELVEPLAPAQPIHLKVNLQNNGKTVARGMTPQLEFKFLRGDQSFEPTYDEAEKSLAWNPTTSDLAPGEPTTLYSTNRLTLQHGHDVQAVLTGGWKLYFYGRIPYKDILHRPHEFHFCGLYQQVPGADPLKLSKCPTYNETD